MSFLFQITQLAGMRSSISFEYAFKTNIRVDEHTCTLYCGVGFAVGHPVLLDQVSHNYGGTTTDTCGANDKDIFTLCNLILYDLVCFIEMFLYRVIRHVIYVQHTALHTVLLVCQEILSDPINPQHEFNLMFLKPHRVQT